MRTPNQLSLRVEPVVGRRPRYCSLAGVAVMLTLLSGCASPKLHAIAKGATVSITVSTQPVSLDPMPIGNDTIGADAGIGMGSGMLVGGLWGLTCGPFFIICSPLGAVLGVGVGGAAGAAVGVTGELPKVQADRLRGRWTRAQQPQGIAAGLRHNLDSLGAMHWVLVDTPAKTSIAVDVLSVRLMSTRDERIRFALSVRVAVTGSVPTSLPSVQVKTYEYISAYSKLNAWLDDSGDWVEDSLALAERQLALEIMSDLAVH